tara:strand:+ start:70 stop:525 length:456 start_codon:yes stop_codon:yes gene_type:complete
MKLRIIQLGILNLDECLILDRKTFQGLWTKSQWERELSDPNRICLGALEVNTPDLIGFCSAWLVLEEMQITSIAVDPLHQRKGIGKYILSNLIKKSKSLEINRILLEVKDKNEPAKALYKSIGFKLIGNRSNFYKDGSNALIFIKDLTLKS